MSQWKRIASKIIADIISEKVFNPDLSYRDLADWKDISHVKVWEVLKEEMPELLTTSNKTKELYEMNVEIINIATAKVMNAMKSMTPEKIAEAKEMQDIVDKSFKQNRLIDWESTDNIWMIGNIDIV